MKFYSTVVPLYIRKFPYQTVYQLNCTKKLYHWLPPCVHLVIVHFASELKGTNPNLVIVLPNHIHLCWKPVGHPSLHTCIHGNFACDLSVWDKIKTHLKWIVWHRSSSCQLNVEHHTTQQSGGCRCVNWPEYQWQRTHGHGFYNNVPKWLLV